MPDPARLTVSASQAPALFGASPYMTRWMLYQYFKGANIESEATSRMDWGLALQPLVLAQAAKERKLQVEANFSNNYVRAKDAPLGATVDGVAFDPDRGPGVIETKCVFDFGVWAREWENGKAPPKHIEVQLQTQMVVGNGEHPYNWGTVVAWVCGDLHYFDRPREGSVEHALIKSAKEFLSDVEKSNEPDPFGADVEAALLKELFPTKVGEVLDLRNHADGHKWAQHAAMFEDFRQKQTFYKKASDDARSKLLALAKSAGTVLLPGATVNVSTVSVPAHGVKESTQRRLKVRIDDNQDDPFG